MRNIDRLYQKYLYVTISTKKVYQGYQLSKRQEKNLYFLLHSFKYVNLLRISVVIFNTNNKLPIWVQIKEKHICFGKLIQKIYWNLRIQINLKIYA